MTRFMLLLWFAAGSQWAWSQSTIAYTDGPPFQIPGDLVPATVDLDADAAPEFSFTIGLGLCTADVPVSLCSWSSYVTAVGTNVILVQSNYAAALASGDWIEPMASSSDLRWGGGEVKLVTWWVSQRYGTSGSAGPLATLGEGYLGVQFSSADGIHYGWVHVREMTVLDWAYETRPGVGIKAGAKPVALLLAPPEVARPGYLRLRWPAQVGKAYQVQAKETLNAVAWTNLGFVIPATATNALLDLPMNGASRFLRVVEAD